jgi:DNA-binding CsgD family transcriptional regulator
VEVPLDLIGRAAELAEIASFLDRSALGLESLVLSGPPGIGKTVLWRVGVHSARARGWTVLSARPDGNEVSLSLSGLTDLLGLVDLNLLRPSLPTVQRRALEVALLKSEPDPGVDARTVPTAVLSVLRALAETNPVLLAVDDAQWLDRATASALQFALRRLERERVGLLLTIRDTDSLAETIGSSVVPGRTAVTSVSPLDLPTTRAVLRARYPGRLGPRALTTVAQASAGNPFYAIEIAREVLRGDAPDGAVPLPGQLRELVQARFARLPSRARQALLTVACLSSPRADLVDGRALASAVTAGLVVEDTDGCLRFTHPLLAAAIYDSVPRPRRRALHRALAGVVNDPEERVRHLALGSEGHDLVIATQLDAAATLAQARGAPAAAAELIELAMGLAPPGAASGQAERQLNGATAHFEAGDLARAQELVQEVLKTTPAGARRASALRLAAHLQSRTAGFVPAVNLATEALGFAGKDPGLVAALHLDLVFFSTSLGDFASALPHAEAALQCAANQGLGAMEAQALAVRTVIRFLLGQQLCELDLARAVELEGVALANPIMMSPRTISGLIALWQGQPAMALDVLGRQRNDTQEQGREPDSVLMYMYLVWAAVWKGEITTAIDLAEQSLVTAARLEDRIASSLAHSASALANSYAGNEGPARAGAEEAGRLFAEMDWRSGAIWSSWALGFLELSLGHYQAVNAVLAPLSNALGDMAAIDPVIAVFLPDHVEALTRLGQLDRADELLGPFESKAAALRRTWAVAAAARCRGLLKAARADLGGALTSLQEALLLLEQLGLPFERARTLLELGCLQRRMKQWRLARATLERAYDEFDRLGAPIWAGRADTELARVPGRTRPAGLSATEESIARLAADGLTNKAIADRSFVTVKTVEANLARAYQKLGITSRAQLARALDREPAAQK